MKAFVEDARSLTPGSRVFDSRNELLTFFPGQDTSTTGLWGGNRPYDLLFRTYRSHPAARIVAKTQPGFAMRSIEVYGLSDDYARRTLGLALQLAADIQVPDALAADPSTALAYRVLANAEPLPGYFCREGFVEDWDASKVYGNVGDKVRYGDFIYASNVPRNFLRANLAAGSNQLAATITATPENSPRYWTRFASCQAHTTDCSGARQWSLGGDAAPANPATADWSNAGYASGDRATFNGQLYEFAGDNAHEVPGAFASRQRLLAAELYAEVDEQRPIPDHRVFVYPKAASWRLLGNCSDRASWARATIVPGVGVSGVTPRAVDAVQHHPGEPVFVEQLTRNWTFSFQLGAGHQLDDVYVDGVPMGLAPHVRSVNVAFDAAKARPTYIEIETRR